MKDKLIALTGLPEREVTVPRWFQYRVQWGRGTGVEEGAWDEGGLCRCRGQWGVAGRRCS